MVGRGLGTRSAPRLVGAASLRAAGFCGGHEPFSPSAARRRCIETLFGAGSDTRARAGPGRLRLARSHQHAGVVDDVNWTWRLPWPVDDLVRECAPLGARSIRSGRSGVRHGRATRLLNTKSRQFRSVLGAPVFVSSVSLPCLPMPIRVLHVMSLLR